MAKIIILEEWKKTHFNLIDEELSDEELNILNQIGVLTPEFMGERICPKGEFDD